MAIAGTRQTLALWRGKLILARAVIKPSPAILSGRDKYLWAMLRCAPAAIGAAWGALLVAAVLLRPTDCASGACNALLGVALFGAMVLLAAGTALFSVYFTNRPRVIVPPWLRDQPGVLAWDRGRPVP